MYVNTSDGSGVPDRPLTMSPQQTMPPAVVPQVENWPALIDENARLPLAGNGCAL